MGIATLSSMYLICYAKAMSKIKPTITRGMSIFDIAMLFDAGMTQKQIEKELKTIDIEASKEKGKCFGECASCGYETTLVKDVSLCGPCCFGEAATVNGNW